MPATVHHFTPPAPTLQGKLRERLRQYDEARIEVARYQRERHDLIRRLAQGNVHDITTARLTNCLGRLDHAIAQQSALEGILLDASVGLDMNLPEDRATAMHEALDRAPTPTWDANNEHRLTAGDYGVGGR